MCKVQVKSWVSICTSSHYTLARRTIKYIYAERRHIPRHNIYSNSMYQLAIMALFLVYTRSHIFSLLSRLFRPFYLRTRTPTLFPPHPKPRNVLFCKSIVRKLVRWSFLHPSSSLWPSCHSHRRRSLFLNQTSWETPPTSYSGTP